MPVWDRRDICMYKLAYRAGGRGDGACGSEPAVSGSCSACTASFTTRIGTKPLCVIRSQFLGGNRVLMLLLDFQSYKKPLLKFTKPKDDPRAIGLINMTFVHRDTFTKREKVSLPSSIVSVRPPI